jgi:flagellar hook assembly protein FlgD
VGNIPYAPHFVNPLADDYHLRSWSPAVNAGDPNYTSDPNEKDIDGNPRIQLGRVDMGVHESPVVSPDTDADGLPDDWELRYWGNLGHGPAEDPDGDGISNLGEYLFGRSPIAANSDSPRILMVAWDPNAIDIGSSQTTQIRYILDRHGQVTINFYNAGTNQLVRTVTAAQPAGLNTLTWDGHGDPNDPNSANPPVLPQDAYYFTIAMSDPQAHQATWQPQSTGPWTSSNVTINPTTFNPYLNEYVEIGFTLPDMGYLPLTIYQRGSGATIRNLKPFAPAGVPQTVLWDGRDNQGHLYSGDFDVYFGVPQGVPVNSILVRSETIQVTQVKCQAYLIIPSYAEVSTIGYTLSAAGNVTVSMENPNGEHFRTLLDNVSQPAGPQTVVWNGRNDVGKVISVEGNYTVTITARDPATGSSATRYGVVVAYR